MSTASVAAVSQPPLLRAPFQLHGAADLARRPPMRWCVKGLLPAQGIAALFGPSTSGKSFLALDLGAAIAEGRTWFGHRVTQRDVVYVALEGADGFAARVAAWEVHHMRPAPERLRFITEPANLTDDVLKFVVSLTGTDNPVIIFDTLNAAIPGADENSSRDMGMAIAAAKDLARFSVGGLVLLVAHTGKNEERGMRGHSLQFAALDAAIQTTRDGDVRSWCSAKVKDGIDGDTHGFRLHQVVLGTDDEGDAITSCVVEQTNAPAKVQARRTSKAAGAIVEFLTARSSGVTKTELVAHFEGRYHHTTIYRELAKLVEAETLHDSLGSVSLAVAKS